MKRALPYLIAASLFAVSFAANAKGGKGGGRGCSTGHSSAGHSGHSGGGSAAFLFGTRPGGYSGYGAGYVRQDGTYIEAPRQDCPVGQVCDPALSRPAPQL